MKELPSIELPRVTEMVIVLNIRNNLVLINKADQLTFQKKEGFKRSLYIAKAQVNQYLLDPGVISLRKTSLYKIKNHALF